MTSPGSSQTKGRERLTATAPIANYKSPSMRAGQRA
jgi:hypothetical protein